MTITVQSRAPGGQWETRNTFPRTSGALAQALHIADMWRVNYPDGREIRVFDSDDDQRTRNGVYSA